MPKAPLAGSAHVCLKPVSCCSSNRRAARCSMHTPSANGTRRHGSASPTAFSWLHDWRPYVAQHTLVDTCQLASYPAKVAISSPDHPFLQRRTSVLSSRVKTYQDATVGTRQGQAFKQTGGVVALTICCYMAHLRNCGSTSAAQALVGRSLAGQVSPSMRDVSSGEAFSGAKLG